MTFILANEPYHFNDFQIGLFGIVGLAGVFATPWAGKKIAAGLENKIAVICMGLLMSAWIPYFCAAVSGYLRCWCDYGVLRFVSISCA